MNRILIILLCIISNSCITEDRTCISKIKWVGDYKDSNSQVDYYYVYGFNKSDGCYEKLADSALKFQLDTSKNHVLEFFKYSEDLPDTSKINQYNLADGKYRNNIILEYSFSKVNQRKKLYFSDDLQLIEIFNVKSDSIFTSSKD